MDAIPVNHRREVTGVVFLAFAVILGISYYLPESVTGILGTILRETGKGLFGVCAYAIPVLFIYSAIDFFVEKRENVSPRRVLSVLILLVAVSAILPVITVNLSVLKMISLDPTHNQALASKAIENLWKSGIRPDLLAESITKPPVVLTGGVLGGSIALGLQMLAERTGALIVLSAFILSQIVLIFNVSLSRTASKTAEAIRFTSQRASGAIRSGAESLRAYSRQGGLSENESARSVDPNGSLPGNSTYSTIPVREYSPFDEMQFEMGQPQGFIDLDGTDAPMTANSYRGPYSPYDVDLSRPQQAPYQPNRNTRDPVQDLPVDQHVETDFLRSARDPMPTSEAHAISEIPDFLREKEEATWLDIRMNTKNASDPVLSHIPIQRIGVDGRVVHASELDEFDESEMPQVYGAADEKTISRKAPATSPIPPTGLDRSSTNVLYGTGGAAQPSRTVPSKPSQRQIPITFPKPVYKTAPTSLLRPDIKDDTGRASQASLVAQGKKLEDTLMSFGVVAKVINITHGPAITRFELTPGPGIKVSRIVNLKDDVALVMASNGIRIEAPIPGKAAIGIEIPNAETSAVTLRSLLDSPGFKKNASPLLVALGRDIPGNPILCDLTKMPHLLIAGATGSGKSVCINSILISILCKSTPDQVKLIMIDPKVVELSMYNGIPHLLAPVVTDPKKAANTLNWAVGEMTRRYGLFAEVSVRDFRGYNEELARNREQPLPLVLIVIDELADLMQVASKEVEESIARLTAMARAAGIHLLIATQRPSVDVITGVIKANIPSRIAFAVSSQVDSRTILDMSGAENLLGKGDMLYYPQSAAKPQRGQGAFVSDGEVESVIEYLKSQNMGTYDPEEVEAIISASLSHAGSSGDGSKDEDELLPQAVEIVLMAGCASVSILQRRMNIGYPRAARLIDHMQDKGYVGPFEGSKPRKLLISQSQWLEIQAKGG
jgi:DNA segregation ATPase FtsK/SpoIIIE-like protein